MKPKPRPKPRETQFLNVDLDIEAPHDLRPLVEALAAHVFILQAGGSEEMGYQAHLELLSLTTTAESAIQGFIDLLSGLSPEVRRRWDEATRRDFNIGIEAGTQPHVFEFSLSPDTLHAVAQLRASIVMTVYAVDVESSR